VTHFKIKAKIMHTKILNEIILSQ